MGGSKSSKDNETAICSVHGSSRGKQNLIDDGEGGYKCYGDFTCRQRPDRNETTTTSWDSEKDHKTNKSWGDAEDRSSKSNKSWADNDNRDNKTNKSWGDDDNRDNKSNKSWGDDDDRGNKSNKSWGNDEDNSWGKDKDEKGKD